MNGQWQDTQGPPPSERLTNEEEKGRSKRTRLSGLSSSAQASQPQNGPLATKSISSKGGFIPIENPSSVSLSQGRKSTSRHQTPHYEPTLLLPLEANEKCSRCSSIELDFSLKESFGVNVCSNCREKYRQDFSLITKTMAKEEFLLTDEELRDRSVLPCITRPNPLKSTWSDMQLFLLSQIRRFAIEKWGSLEAIQQEQERRVESLQLRKEKKFKSKLSELRRKTKIASTLSANAAATSTRHVHDFESIDETNKKCKICGLLIESEEL